MSRDARADEVWAPLFADWQRRLGRQFTVAELETVTRFLTLTAELGAEHAERLRDSRQGPGG